ncbi:MAG: NAD(P)H-quinone oxidoreductase [Rhizobiaceae bacterium]
MRFPQTMTAISITSPGRPEVLEAREHRVPQLKDGEVLIKVAAAGVNRPDCLQRLGAYPPPPGAPDIPGLEVAGEIVSSASDVDQSQIGRKVMALVPGGGYGEYVAAHLSNTLSIPKGLGMAQAACVPETFFTVWHNVFQRGGLKDGECFLVHGGTSGIGTTAIQLARAFGAKVIATAGSDEKCQACLELGADLAINYRSDDFVKASEDFTGGKGVDVILDMVGGSYIARNYEAAAIEGRIVQIAFLGGPKAEVNFSRLMMKRLTHTGSTLRARDVGFKARIARELENCVWPLMERGDVKPVMDSHFPLADAAAAHRRMEDGGHVGKIVLEVA